MIKTEEHHEHRRTPEEKLWIAVITRGVLDYLFPTRFMRQEMGYDTYLDAVDFCEGWRLRVFCDFVGLNGEAVQEQVIAVKKDRNKLPTMWKLRKG